MSERRPDGCPKMQQANIPSNGQLLIYDALGQGQLVTISDLFASQIGASGGAIVKSPSGNGVQTIQGTGTNTTLNVRAPNGGTGTLELTTQGGQIACQFNVGTGSTIADGFATNGGLISDGLGDFFVGPLAAGNLSASGNLAFGNFLEMVTAAGGVMTAGVDTAQSGTITSSLVFLSGGSTATRVLPAVATPTIVIIKNGNSGTLTVSADAGSDIQPLGSTTGVASYPVTTGNATILFSDGTHWNRIL
jgi:hypothetical protein